MPAWAIHGCNGLALVIILIGLPSSMSARVGPWHLSAGHAEPLTLWGLALMAGFNLAASLGLARTKRTRALFRNWSLAFAGFLVVSFLTFRHAIHFSWLTRFLIWLKKVFG